MDNKRLILLMAFGFSLIMLWDAWQKQNQPKPPLTSSQPSAPSVSPVPNTSLAAAPGTAVAPTLAPGQPPALANIARARVKTDLFVAEVTSQGGDLVSLNLTRHKAAEDGSKDFVLLENTAEHLYQAQSGLMGEGLPNHKTEYKLSPGVYELQPGAASLELRLEAPESTGIKVTKL